MTKQVEKAAGDLQSRLQAPFNEDEISWKPGTIKEWKSGEVSALYFPYIAAPKYRDRLDAVCGWTGWEAKYTQTEKGLTLCDLSIWLNEQQITRQGVGDHTANQSQSGDKELDEEHGSRTRAFRDACKQFGIGGHHMDGLQSPWTKVDAYEQNGKLRIKGLLEPLLLANCKYSGAAVMSDGKSGGTGGSGNSPFNPDDWANVKFKAGKLKDRSVGSLTLDELYDVAEEDWVQKYPTYKNAIEKAIKRAEEEAGIKV